MLLGWVMFSDAQSSVGMVQVTRNDLTGVPMGIHGHRDGGHEGISPEAFWQCGSEFLGDGQWGSRHRAWWVFWFLC